MPPDTALVIPGLHPSELFDFAAMPGARCPLALGPNTVEFHSVISFDRSIETAEQQIAV